MDFNTTTIGFIVGFLGYFLIKFLVQTGLMMFRHHKQNGQKEA